ncbi:hypothetical protein GCM10020254_10630 [Streptomyces goshikiensis]
MTPDSTSTPAGSGVNRCPEARARSHPCTVRSSSMIVPTRRAGWSMAPVVPSSAPGSAQAATSRSACPANRSRHSGSPFRRSGSFSKALGSFRASPSKLTMTSKRCSSKPRTSYPEHGVGSPSRSSRTVRTTGTVRAAAAPRRELMLLSFMAPP